MNTQAALQQHAVDAAKRQDWSAAVAHNLALLELNPDDVGAHNRLGVAYMQLNQLKEATAVFQTVLKIDRSNTIAKKHLERLKSNQISSPPAFAHEDFIEEPGITKIVELKRLAGKQVLEKLAIGQACELKPKNRYISVEQNATYIGALPEDLSFRLSKLIDSGNTYSCHIRACSPTSCDIHLRELSRSKVNQDIQSFPPAKSSMSSLSDLDERFLEDDIPVQIVDVDTDVEPDFEEIREDSDEL